MTTYRLIFKITNLNPDLNEKQYEVKMGWRIKKTTTRAKQTALTVGHVTMHQRILSYASAVWFNVTAARNCGIALSSVPS